MDKHNATDTSATAQRAVASGPLVRRIFPAPWLALFIFGSSIVCAAKGNYLAAYWAFIAGAWCQAYYSPNIRHEPRPTE